MENVGQKPRSLGLSVGHFCVMLLLFCCDCLILQAQANWPADRYSSVLEREYKALHTAQDARTQALHAYLLNSAAEEYANALNEAIFQGKTDVGSPEMEAKVKTANDHGAEISRCEYSGGWTARPTGYLTYLKIYPDGPYAEEAWWRGKLGHRLTGCFDGDGSEEETAAFVADYSSFLARFPHGKHKKEARRLLKEFQYDLVTYKQEKDTGRQP